MLEQNKQTRSIEEEREAALAALKARVPYVFTGLQRSISNPEFYTNTYRDSIKLYTRLLRALGTREDPVRKNGLRVGREYRDTPAGAIQWEMMQADYQGSAKPSYGRYALQFTPAAATDPGMGQVTMEFTEDPLLATSTPSMSILRVAFPQRTPSSYHWNLQEVIWHDRMLVPEDKVFPDVKISFVQQTREKTDRSLMLTLTYLTKPGCLEKVNDEINQSPAKAVVQDLKNGMEHASIHLPVAFMSRGYVAFEHPATGTLFGFATSAVQSRVLEAIRQTAVHLS